MATTAVTLAVIAAVLEIVGIVLTVLDIRAARASLARYLTRQRTVYASAGLSAEFSMALDLIPQDRTLAQRIEALEAWRHGLPDELVRRERKLGDALRNDFRRALKASERTIDDQFKGLRDFVVGVGRSHWIKAYRGPLLLAVGVVAGLAANIVSAVQSS
ncbi:hypothetical protein ACFVGN_29165 [Streptomyces sp. NPDC057757]|uniref:hypothetical protein n=1 Tax=Streptomyces sp. NPDC057757 TaxID=3346241 RepID=UPI003679336C